MENRFRKIKDSTTLFRDTTTSAVINKDVSGYETYLQTYEKLKKQQEEFKELKDEVKSINSDISEIKSLLHSLIGRQEHGN
jgi:peptidoglycan hydrolase CwlO-like protein